jgi:hypothetical protein
MSDSGWQHLPAGAVVPGPDGCAYHIPDSTQAAFPVTGSQGRGHAASPVPGSLTERDGISADKRIRESLTRLPQMPVALC